MTDKLTVSSIDNLLVAICHAAVVVEGIFEDGKVDFGDLSRLPALLGVMREFSAVSFADILPQVKDIDPAEAAGLASRFKAALNLKNDDVEATIKQGLDIFVQLASAFGEVSRIFKSILPAAPAAA